jgi:hypothetical protein
MDTGLTEVRPFEVRPRRQSQVTNIVVIELGRKWIVRVTDENGRAYHDGPWNTKWAADRSADLIESGRHGPEPNRMTRWRR